MAVVAARLRAAGSVFAEEEAGVLVDAAGSDEELERLVSWRLAGVPLEVVLGWTEFCGLRLLVAPGVFVPRRRTELLVRLALEIVRAEKHHTSRQMGAFRPVLSPSPAIVELCCGVAPVAAVIAHEVAAERGDVQGEGSAVTPIQVHAADIDPVAVACARTNLNDRGHTHTGDLYNALPATLRGRVGVLVANAPYVPTEEIPLMPPEARDHEPRTGLDGGTDGLDVQRRIIADAAAWLAPGGHLVLETGRRQAPGTVAACAAAGLAGDVVIDHDLDATAVVARSPATGRSVDSTG